MRGVTLNPEQRAAVEHREGPLLVLAGAGSGKTRVLTARVARLVAEEGIPPHRILAVTFTNKAAGVMRERIAELLGAEPHGLWVGTFHAICARLLRREGDRLPRGSRFSIYDEDDSLRTLRRAMEQAGLDVKRWSPGALRGRISEAKNALVGPEEYAARAFDLAGRAVADVYPLYERALAASQAYDFDDLLVQAVRLLEDHEEVGERYAARFLHVLVDEYQDTNHAQYRIVKRLAAVHRNVCVVGDDDQSIYGWRGADLRNILDFERDFPGAAVVRLEENYRSSAAILHVANEVIARNRDRKEKRLRTVRPGGEPVEVVRLADERAEAAWVVDRIRSGQGGLGAGDSVVLYRTNAQSRPFEDALRRARIPYRIVGGVRFYERREVKDVLSYLQLAVNPADDAAFARAVAWPRRGVGTVTLEKVRRLATERRVPVLAAAELAGEEPSVPRAGAAALQDFAAGIASLAELAREADVEEVMRECIRTFGLATALEAEEDGADRLANLTELLAAAAAFERGEVEDAAADATDLEVYLQSAALHADVDDYDAASGGVTLMTLHNAKGMEFPAVFVVGLEDGLFPLARASESREELEEERRLFYVGVTRAQDRLALLHADRRWRHGSETRSSPSRFLDEIPAAGVHRRWDGAGEPRRRPGGKAGRRRPAGGVEPPPADWSWRRPIRRTAAPSGRAEGVRYDYSDSQEALRLEPGASVVHPEFGPGEIVSVSGSGRSAKAEIDFGAAGRRRVLVAHAGLRPA
ncbi:MAG: UvrD-helicase domain-containing protein [Gemmatimonadota bacterium]|nr:UvrD-helicase domain-containing protein [Gemmatimonadota bacterium]